MLTPGSTPFLPSGRVVCLLLAPLCLSLSLLPFPLLFFPSVVMLPLAFLCTVRVKKHTLQHLIAGETERVRC